MMQKEEDGREEGGNARLAVSFAPPRDSATLPQFDSLDDDDGDEESFMGMIFMRMAKGEQITKIVSKMMKKFFLMIEAITYLGSFPHDNDCGDDERRGGGG